MLSLEDILKKCGICAKTLCTAPIKNLYLGAAELEFAGRCLQGSVLYLGTASQYAALSPAPGDGAGFLLAEDGGEACLPQGTEYGLLPEKSDLRALLNSINSLFFQQRRLTEISAELFQVLIKEGDIRRIVETGGKILGNPIILVDSAYKLLAFSTKKEIREAVWEDLAQNGCCSPPFVQRFKRENIIARAYQTDQPFLVDTGVGEEHGRIINRVVVNGKTYAYIALIEYWQPLAPEDYHILAMLCSVLSAAMQKDEGYAFLSQMLQNNIVYDLLEGRIRDGAALETRQQAAEWFPGRQKELAVFPFQPGSSGGKIMDYHIRRLGEMLPQHTVLQHRQDIVILLSYRREEERGPARERVAAYAGELGMQAGLSGTFTELLGLAKRREEALQALRIGRLMNAGAPLLHYGDYRLEHLLLAAGEGEDLAGFCHPALAALEKYDEEKGSDYLLSLYIYMNSGRSLSAAAKALYVHRNTMAARMGRIEALTGLRLEDGDTALHLLLSYKILRLARGGKLRTGA